MSGLAGYTVGAVWPVALLNKGVSGMATIWMRGLSHMHTEEVEAMCKAREGVEEITDECAVTIASWWQSPGARGQHFAALASGGQADTDGLFSDISYALDAARRTQDETEREAQLLQLGMLGTWLIAKTNGHTAEQGDDNPKCVTCGKRPWGFGYCGEECKVCAQQG